MLMGVVVDAKCKSTSLSFARLELPFTFLLGGNVVETRSFRYVIRWRMPKLGLRRRVLSFRPEGRIRWRPWMMRCYGIDRIVTKSVGGAMSGKGPIRHAGLRGGVSETFGKQLQMRPLIIFDTAIRTTTTIAFRSEAIQGFVSRLGFSRNGRKGRWRCSRFGTSGSAVAA